jgi:hypothetical protein
LTMISTGFMPWLLSTLVGLKMQASMIGAAVQKGVPVMTDEPGHLRVAMLQ